MMSNWKVGYEIDGEDFEVLIPDGSDPDIPGRPRYIGHDEAVFSAHVASEHPGVHVDEVDIRFSIPAAHPMASFF